MSLPTTGWVVRAVLGLSGAVLLSGCALGQRGETLRGEDPARRYTCKEIMAEPHKLEAMADQVSAIVRLSEQPRGRDGFVFEANAHCLGQASPSDQPFDDLVARYEEGGGAGESPMSDPLTPQQRSLADYVDNLIGCLDDPHFEERAIERLEAAIDRQQWERARRIAVDQAQALFNLSSCTRLIVPEEDPGLVGGAAAFARGVAGTARAWDLYAAAAGHSSEAGLVRGDRVMYRALMTLYRAGRGLGRVLRERDSKSLARAVDLRSMRRLLSNLTDPRRDVLPDEQETLT